MSIIKISVRGMFPDCPASKDEDFAMNFVRKVRETNPTVKFPKRITIGGFFKDFVWICFKSNSVKNALIAEAEQQKLNFEIIR